MSLIPLIYSNWWENLEHPHHVPDQNFGSSMDSSIAAVRAWLSTPRKDTSRCPMGYYRPWVDLMRSGKVVGSSTVQANKDKFHVDLDVQQFSPEEISVKVVDRSVIVEGKHEEKQDEHGWISRQFCRRYMIPEQCDIDQVSSKLSSDGVLSITVPRKQKLGVEGERVINIEHTGRPAVREGQSEPQKSEEEKEGSSS